MTRVVAWHEFLFAVKRPSFLIMTFGMPVIVALHAAVFSLLAAVTMVPALSGIAEDIAVVDETGLLAKYPAPPPAIAARRPTGLGAHASRLEETLARAEKRKIARFADLAEAKRALLAGKVERFLHVPADYVARGRLHVYRRESKLIGDATDTAWLGGRLDVAIMRDGGLADAAIARTRAAPRETTWEPDGTGAFRRVRRLQQLLARIVPLAVAMLLFFSLMINASVLAAGIAEEKENKVLEVLLSSVRPEQLLLGKVLGLCAAAVGQMSVWLAMMAAGPGLLVLALGRQVDLGVDAAQLALAALFYLLGFLFYGSLLVGFGSLGGSARESQQASAFVTLALLVPMFAATTILDAPNGMLARALSYVPPFTPLTMMLRIGSGAVPWWDTALAAATLLLGVRLAVGVSARLFRAGTLAYGKPLNPLTILRLALRAA